MVAAACGAILGLAFTLTGPAPEGPEEASHLVRQLGSARFAERLEAETALVARGRDALAPLVAARRSDDPEIQARAEVLIDRIERGLLSRPTRVEAAGQDEPVGRILANLRDRSAFAFEIDRGIDPDWLDRPARLEEDGPVAFWDALGRLGLEGYWVIDRDSALFGPRAEPVLHVRPHGAAVRVASTNGPLGVVARPPGAPADRFGRPGEPSARELRLDFPAEPPVRIRRLLGVTVRRAESSGGDDPLIEPGTVGELLLDEDWAAGPGAGAQPTASALLRLRAPAGADARLDLLELDVVVELEGRRSEPFELALLAGGDAFAAPADLGDALIRTARLLRPAAGEGPALELIARPEGWNDLARPMRGGRRRLDRLATEVERVLDRIELVDDQDRPVRLTSRWSVRFDPDGFRATVPLDPTGRSSPRALRYHGSIRETVTLRAELRDVPLGGPPR